VPPVTLPSMYSLGGCALPPFQTHNLSAASSANFMSYAMDPQEILSIHSYILGYSHICYLGVRGRRH
jgi:hypothetical protein